jgi:hypothetical protein
VISTDSTFADAYKMCADYFEDKNDQEKALKFTRQYKFHSWVPDFCQHIELNEENSSILEKLDSDEALECVKTTLGEDLSRRSTEFLGAICYHHYHGAVEDEAFEQLEKRGINSEETEKDFVGSILMYLISKCRSFCTIKGAANALAGMKHPELFKHLAHFLPKDVSE